MPAVLAVTASSATSPPLAPAMAGVLALVLGCAASGAGAGAPGAPVTTVARDMNGARLFETTCGSPTSAWVCREQLSLP